MSKKPLNALIVEDDEDDALLILRALDQQGFDVAWERVWTAPAMRSNLEDESWDVVLSDYSMPSFDAPAALRLLQESGQDIPFIVISGTVGEAAAVAAMKNGAHDYLMKGRLARLGAAIERELRDAVIRRDHRRAIDKIQHLNHVLRAIRNVNQLIVQEKDRERLLRRAADMLVETRGYSSALCVHIDDNQQPVIVALSVAADECAPAPVKAILGTSLTACMKEALRSTGPVIRYGDTPDCRDCPLHSVHADRHRVTRTLEHDGRAFGVLRIVVPEGIIPDAEELDLNKEMAGDLAFALHAMDKTERLTAETALTEAALNAMQDTFFLFDPATGTALRWNEAFREASGYSDDEIAALPAPQSYYDADDLQRAAAVMETVAREGSGGVTLELITKTGRRIPTEYAVTSIRDSAAGETLVISVGRDITERREAEEALRKSEAQLSSALQMARAGHWKYDVARDLFTFNDSFYLIFRTTAAEAGGYEMSSADYARRFCHPDDAALVGAEVRAAIEAADPGYSKTIEHRILYSDGGVGHIAVRFSIVKDSHGHTVGTYGVNQDITERKQYQAQIAQSDRLASMGMLAAGVAHEINNPLAYILYNLESLTDDLPRLAAAMRKGLGIVAEQLGEDEWARLMGQDQALLNPSLLDDIHSRLEDALKGTHRIRDVARGLGAFSRVEKDRRVPVNLMHVLEIAVSMVHNEIKYRARLVKEYGKISPIMASDGRLSQVFLNLLINAAHAIPEGDFEGNEIRMRTWQEGDWVLAEVRDTGQGISAAHLPQLFDPFFTTKELGTGTGLGLSISKGIVEDHGGRIEVTSEVGKGTSFVVRLPVDHADADRVEVRPATRKHDEPAIRGRILVIDDEAAIRSILKRMLGRAHEVITASSGEEGKGVLEEDTAFDLILCDMMMSHMSGLELHAWLAEQHPALSDNMVFITGGAFTPKAREYLQQVDNLTLEKPFDTPNLVKMVRELVIAARSKGSGERA